MQEQPKLGEFCWNELASPNVQASKDFYGKVFGWKFHDENMGDMTYTIIKHKDNKGFGGIWSIPKDQEKHVPPHWMAYILVNDLDESVDKARNHGATIVRPASNAGEMGRFAVIKDPTGAHIALWQSLI